MLLEPFEPEDYEDDELPQECISCGEVAFELDPTCELGGELTVEIGHGQDRFIPLDDGEAPAVFTSGGFQGGGTSSHIYLSVRIGNVAPERYDMLELEVETYRLGECPDDGQPCGWSDWGRTQVIGGGDEPFSMADGLVVEPGIFMSYDDHVTTQVVVRDPCGREGWAQHRW